MRKHQALPGPGTHCRPRLCKDSGWAACNWRCRHSVASTQASRRRVHVHAGPTWGSSSDDPAIRDAVRRLSRLFYTQSSESPGSPGSTGQPPAAARPGTRRGGASRPDVLRDLPCWRAPTAVLPGSQELLHVHSPSSVHMFDTLFASKPWVASAGATGATPSSQQFTTDIDLVGVPPWQFGHIYTPGSNAAGGGQDPELQPGTGAPLVGVLMEVTRAIRLTDGKLMLLASALTRFRVLRCVQTSPYLLADVALYPDDEESRALHGLSLATALEAAADRQPPVSIEHVMAAADEASHAAAAASGLAWHAYEHHIPRSQAWRGTSPQEGTGGSTAERTASSAGLLAALASAGILDCLPLPGGTVAGQWQPLQQVAARAEATAKEAAQQVANATFQAAANTAPSTAGQGAATSTPADVASTGEAEVRCESWSWRLAGPLPGLNTVVDRGVALPWADLPRTAIPDLTAGDHHDVEQLERLVWQELDTLAVVTLKARQRALSLPLGLLQMRPATPPAVQPPAAANNSSLEQALQQPGAATSEQQTGHVGHWGAASEGLDVTAPPEWPVWRRAQRLSYALAGLCSEAAIPDQRQAFLELPSTCERLAAALQLLQRQRGALATRVMLQEVAKGARLTSSTAPGVPDQQQQAGAQGPGVSPPAAAADTTDPDQDTQPGPDDEPRQ